MKRIFTLAIVTVVLMVNSIFAGESIVLTTLEWEPYIGENLPGQGFVAEIVKEAFKRSGYDVKFQYYPWARTVQMSDSGEVDGYFPEYYAKERESVATFSEPFDGGPVVFFKRKADKISFKTLNDLKPYKIGVVRDYVNEEKFDAAKYLQKEEVTDDLTNIKKLIAGRVDLFVADKFVGLYTAKKELAEKAALIEFMEPPLVTHKLYVCISKKAKNGTAKMDAFDKGLKQMKADGSYNKILEKYGFGNI